MTTQVTSQTTTQATSQEEVLSVKRAASTPPASSMKIDPETSKDPKLDMLDMEARKTTTVSGTKASPLEGDLIAPFVDLTNCTRAELPWDSVAAHAILAFGVEDFTTRNFDVTSWRVKPKKPVYESESDDEDSSSSESEEEKDEDGLHTRLTLGLGIHETEFKGEKVFLELRFMKDGPKTLMNNRCGVLVHNKLMAIFVEGVGRGDFIQEFLEEMIRRLPVKQLPPKSRTEFEIYRWDHEDAYWNRTQRQKGRDMKSVILPKGLIEKVHGDMSEFLSKETAAWYETFGIPYKRSYLFHGVPGSGKTSLITALAGKLKRNVCFLSAHHPNFSDDAMKRAMDRLPRRAFLIMEDIDSLFNQRTSMNVRSPLTFTGLLNCLDGIGHASGQIVIMTTNYIDRLDEALIRAGRADMWVEFKCATKWQLGELFKWFYHKTPKEAENWKETFVNNCWTKFPDGVTIAEMQQHFVDNRKSTPKECAEGVKDYDMPTRKFCIGQKAKAKKEFDEKDEKSDDSKDEDEQRKETKEKAESDDEAESDEKKDDKLVTTAMANSDKVTLDCDIVGLSVIAMLALMVIYVSAALIHFSFVPSTDTIPPQWS